MKNSIRRILHFILILVSLVSASFIVFYYWTASNINDLRELPTVLLTYIIFFILAQLIKRYVKKQMKWYDWIYYLGLIAILIPLPLFFSSGEWMFSVTKYGSLLLFIPSVIELFVLVAKGKSN
ncbi:MAG: hypothetical protein WEA99_05095 [Brumimicrobium sp.]